MNEPTATVSRRIGKLRTWKIDGLSGVYKLDKIVKSGSPVLPGKIRAVIISTRRDDITIRLSCNFYLLKENEYARHNQTNATL